MYSEDVYDLTNTEFCFIYSQGCMAGGFDDPYGYDCIAEDFTVKTDTGAFAGIEWNNTYGGDGHDELETVLPTNDGGYIAIGTCNDAGWLIKTDIIGNIVWEKHFGKTGYLKIDTGEDVIQTSDNGYVFTGITKSYDENETMEVWLLKTDDEGNEIWHNTFGYGRGFSLKQTSDDGFIIWGDTKTGPGPSPDTALLIKTDSSGNEIWRKLFWEYPDDRGWGKDVDITSDGGYILTGHTGLIGGEDINNLFLIKTDEDGVELWTKTYCTNDGSRGQSVQETSDGSFIVGGYIQYDDDPDTKMWLLKTDCNGNEEWDTRVSYFDFDCLGFDAQQTDDGGYVIAGKHDRLGNHGSIVVKTDDDGLIEWELIFTPENHINLRLYSIRQTDDGGYIVGGRKTVDRRGNGFIAKIGHVPNIELIKPNNGLYFCNIMLRSFLMRNPLIIGPVDVEVEASDDEYDIDRVGFYVDGQLMETDTTVPYSWRWNKLSFFRHSLKVAAFNSNGNVCVEEKTVWKFF